MKRQTTEKCNAVPISGIGFRIEKEGNPEEKDEERYCRRSADKTHIRPEARPRTQKEA